MKTTSGPWAVTEDALGPADVVLRIWSLDRYGKPYGIVVDEIFEAGSFNLRRARADFALIVEAVNQYRDRPTVDSATDQGVESGQVDPLGVAEDGE